MIRGHVPTSNRTHCVDYGHASGIKTWKITAPSETKQFFSENWIPYSIYNGVARAICVT